VFRLLLKKKNWGLLVVRWTRTGASYKRRTRVFITGGTSLSGAAAPGRSRVARRERLLVVSATPVSPLPKSFQNAPPRRGKYQSPSQLESIRAIGDIAPLSFASLGAAWGNRMGTSARRLSEPRQSRRVPSASKLGRAIEGGASSGEVTPPTQSPDPINNRRRRVFLVRSSCRLSLRAGIQCVKCKTSKIDRSRP